LTCVDTWKITSVGEGLEAARNWALAGKWTRPPSAPKHWIECEFTALRYFTLDGSDYPSHAAQEAAIAGYLRWGNRHCHPKRHFAANSKIRRPDYLPNVA
jgi:hypothetical protein